MRDTELHVRLGPVRPDRARQAFGAITTYHECISHTPVGDFGEHAVPELCALAARWPNPHPEDVAFTANVDTHCELDGPVRDLTVAYLEHDCVDQDHWVDLIRWPVLASHHVAHDAAGDTTDHVTGHVLARDIGQMRGDNAGGHTFGVQRDDHVITTR
jgi:hypothetical protein